ncbi:MAG TPA: histidinol-phosphate transaminase [Bacteroidia bacterium]|nr:histidinol-phosphate transaminase [Bacteroidia bacterium]
MFDIQALLRDNIRNLASYSSARSEFNGHAEIFLDANENNFGSPGSKPYNRHPDPLQVQLKEKITQIKGVPLQNIFLGNGSVEVIDLLLRSFCNPQTDNVIIAPPTYGMYEVSAAINDVPVKKIPLTDAFQLDVEAIAEATDERTKMIFICSPNNPTGNSMNREDVEIILNNFHGLVVVDEAFINYSRQRSFIGELTEYANLVVIQTLSKAWGLAGIRIGMAFASEAIIGILNRVKPPYNIGTPAQELALAAFDRVEEVNRWIKITVQERQSLIRGLMMFDFVKKIFPSDANFVLVRFTHAESVYRFLLENGIVVRDQSQIAGCENCLRVTVGTPDENVQLLQALSKFKKSM